MYAISVMHTQAGIGAISAAVSRRWRSKYRRYHRPVPALSALLFPVADAANIAAITGRYRRYLRGYFSSLPQQIARLSRVGIGAISAR